jgi:hypothetical protein
MSLDLYLHGEPRPIEGATGIFIRIGGERFEITRAEWDRRHPGREPVTYISDKTETTVVWHRNMTHNLNNMAMEAGLYEALWRPDEVGATHAGMLVGKLEVGLDKLVSAPDKFKSFNPDNGWGNYDQLVDFTRSFLEACRQHPETTVYACR